MFFYAKSDFSRLALHFKCESFNELLSLLISGTAFRGVGHFTTAKVIVHNLHVLITRNHIISQTKISPCFDVAAFDHILFIVVIARGGAFIADVDVTLYVNIRI
jgi:hypothetical protein